MFIALSLVWGLWFLLHHQYWAFTGTSLGYPVVVLCHGDSVTLALQDQPHHMLQQIIALIQGLGGCWVDQPACSPSSSTPGELSSTALASLPYVVSRKEQGQFSCPYVIRLGSPIHTCTTRANSTVLPSWGVGATLPSAASGKRQGQLFCHSNLRDGSPACSRPQ